MAKAISWKRLPDGSPERDIARIAEIATNDTVFGGARAMVLAEKAVGMGLEVGGDLLEAVSEIYSRSTGKHSPEYGAWECSECGCAHLGKGAALLCCAENID